MSYLSDATRERVRQRAKNRCEYCLCHQDFVFAVFQIDHIWPVSLGGTDEEENLCLACEMCNQYKWARIEGIDPLSGNQATLSSIRAKTTGMTISFGAKMGLKLLVSPKLDALT